MTALPILPRRNGMYVLYDSDNFAVVHMQTSYGHAAGDVQASASGGGRQGADGAAELAPELFVAPATHAAAPGRSAADVTAPALRRHGFEIVDKRSGRYLYLDGSWAEIFIQQIATWQRHTPTREEVEDTLAGYAHLAGHRLVLH